MPYRVKEGYTVAVGRGVLRSGSLISEAAARHIAVESLLERGVIEEVARPPGRGGSHKKATAKSAASTKARTAPKTRRTTRTAKGAT